MRALARRPPAWAITAGLAVVYLIAAPPSPDLAAASYRSDLFSRAGFTLWDNSWYGGHHLPAYSVLAPALGDWLGPQLLAALSMTIAVALFTALLAGRLGERTVRIASLWLAIGASVALLSSRVPFDLGLALGLGALLLAQRGRPVGAGLLTVLCSLASPVAGAFLALAYVTWAIVGNQRGRHAALAVLALVPIALLSVAFPEGGTQPFVASAFYPALAGVLLIALATPPEQRLLRIGALLYAAALTASFLLPTAVGGNVDRLGALMAGPIAACALMGGSLRDRRTQLLVLIAPALLYWQVNAPLADFAAAVSDPAVDASFYRPLLGELSGLGIGYAGRPARIEVVPGVTHWEARWVAPHVMLARGWERQLDRHRNPLFYESADRLTPSRYHRWLVAQGVSYVALSDGPLDYSAKAEARLLRAGTPYLSEVWHSAHWRLFAVLEAPPLAQPPGRLLSAGTDDFTLRAPRAGAYTVLLHFTPYWALSSGTGCVSRAPGDWTEVRTRRGGDVRVVIRFSLSRVLSRGARCN